MLVPLESKRVRIIFGRRKPGDVINDGIHMTRIVLAQLACNDIPGFIALDVFKTKWLAGFRAGKQMQMFFFHLFFNQSNVSGRECNR